MSSLRQQYADFFSSFGLYRKGYGGFLQILLSPYFLFAVIFTALSFNEWANKPNWEAVIITTAPPLIAFSLGAIAIFNSIGDSKFRDALLDAEESEISPYVEINSMFVHFIFVQTVAFLIALTSSSLPASLNALLSADVKYGRVVILIAKSTAFLIFSYGMMQILATALAILKISNSISNIHNMSKNIEVEEVVPTATYVTINESMYVDKVITKNTYQYTEEE